MRMNQVNFYMKKLATQQIEPHWAQSCIHTKQGNQTLEQNSPLGSASLDNILT